MSTAGTNDEEFRCAEVFFELQKLDATVSSYDRPDILCALNPGGLVGMEVTHVVDRRSIGKRRSDTRWLKREFEAELRAAGLLSFVVMLQVDHEVPMSKQERDATLENLVSLAKSTAQFPREKVYGPGQLPGISDFIHEVRIGPSSRQSPLVGITSMFLSGTPDSNHVINAIQRKEANLASYRARTIAVAQELDVSVDGVWLLLVVGKPGLSTITYIDVLDGWATRPASTGFDRIGVLDVYNKTAAFVV